LLANERDQAQVGFSRRSGPVMGYEMTEVIGSTTVATLACLLPPTEN
jgi:hypothetical protein